MAVSKIWPIYQTLDKAIKYICNYDKTQDGTLIDTFQCTERFADYEFKDVACKARKVKKSRIAYHTMIAFSPDDDITPERALELGKEIMDKYTGGNQQYVLTVHTDQKHIHVHCIFNSVSFNDFKKFQIQDKDLNRLEKITDKVCKENGLSVIEKKSGVKGRGKYEYEQHKKKNSWKDALREAIDRNILLADSYEDFLNRMQYEEGYQIKQGKYLSFILEYDGQERATRNRSLGEFYSIESIKDRIANKEKYRNAKGEEKDESEKSVDQLDDAQLDDAEKAKLNFSTEKISFDGTVKKLIDVEKNEKAQEYNAYRKKLNMINISTYAGMINFVKKYHLVYADDFEKVKQQLEEKHSQLTSEIRNIYGELNKLEADVKQWTKFFDNQLAHERYMSTEDKDEKYRLSEANKMYESALYYFKKNGINVSDMTPEKLRQQIERVRRLKEQLEILKAERKEVKDDIKQLSIIAENNQKILGDEFNNNPHNKEMEKNSDREK